MFDDWLRWWRQDKDLDLRNIWRTMISESFEVDPAERKKMKRRLIVVFAIIVPLELAYLAFAIRILKHFAF